MPRGLVARLWEGARRFTATEPRASSPEEESEYQRFSRETNARSGRIFFLGISVGNLLWWLTDPVVYHGQARVLRVFSTFRPLISVGGLFVYALVVTVPALRRHPVASLAIGGAALIGLTARGLSGIGGPSEPWFHFLHLAPPASVLLSCSFAERVASLALILAATLLGYFSFHAGYFHDPNALAAVSFFLFAIVASLVAGVLSERTRRTHFFMRRLLAQQGEELRSLSDRLEERVQEKTAELRALAAHLETARESERAHIARELHDELGQELTAARYTMAYVRPRYARDPHSIGADLEAIDEQLARTAAVTRAIMMDLRPRVLDDLGLVAAVEWLARRAEDRMGLSCDLDLPPDRDLDLDPRLVIAAFRIVQESLTNAGRHAQAARVELTLRCDDARLLISVGDDGVGFEPHLARGGYGLIGMRERVRALHGELSIESAPGQGTRVLARLPLAAEGEEVRP
ncbi:Sensory box histidine kinase [Minicystis rosea]|nr:Sensory box histidine kinase [Minicystis rosea]